MVHTDVRVVKPGGQVAITSFQEDYFYPLKDMMLDRLVGYGVAKLPETWRSVSSEAGCRKLFEQAELQDIRVELKREHLQEVDALRTARGIRLNVPALFTIGAKR